MQPSQQSLGGNRTFRGDCNASKRNASRRSWIAVEERALLNSFKDIIAGGWKTPNGFRSGFIQQLEARMKMYIPGTDLKGDPHIQSKYGTWKKTYREVYEAIGKTGMGWNGTTKTVFALPKDWDNLIMYYPDLAHVREKSFPYYENWVEIYGKDGATGNGAFDFNSIPADDGAGNGVEVVEETNTSSPNPCQSENPTQAQSSSPRSAAKRTTSNGKRKRSEDVIEIVGTFEQMWGRATEALNKVANALERDVDTRVDVQAAAYRRRLFDTVNDLPLTLTRLEKVRATSELGKHQDQLDIFFELPEDAKCDLIYLALEKAAW